MKAAVYTRYGSPDVLHMTNVPAPTPKDNEVLVKTHATTVTAGDMRMRGFIVPAGQRIPARLFLGITGPRRQILGMELAGEVVAAGKNVTRFKIGDEVYAMTLWMGFGGYAQYKCLPEDGMVALKPNNLSFEEAAAVPVGGLTALGMVRKTNIQRGQKVLIYGGSGSVGTYAIQLAKHAGAEVTGVCSTANLDMLKSLGVDHVIDYTREDFTTRAATYDVILDVVGMAPANARNTLKPSGTYLNIKDFNDKPKSDILLDLKALIEAGHLKVVVDRCYPLEQIVDAHRYVDTGRKRGNVIITIPQDH